jgi:hypothetical protein
LHAAWPRKAEGHVEPMLSFLAANIAEVLFELRAEGEFEPPISPRKQAAQWSAVARAAHALDVALGNVERAAKEAAFEIELNVVPSPPVDEADARTFGRVLRAKDDAFRLALVAARYANECLSRPDRGPRRGRQRDEAAHEIGRRAVLAWQRWGGQRATVSYIVTKRGDTVGSPCMRFVEAVLAVTNDVESAAALKEKRPPLLVGQGSGLSRAIVEAVRAMRPAARAELAAVCGISAPARGYPA